MSPTDAKDSSMANNDVIETIRGENTCSKRYENTSTQSINLHFEFVCIINNFLRHCPFGDTNNSTYHMKLKR